MLAGRSKHAEDGNVSYKSGDEGTASASTAMARGDPRLREHESLFSRALQRYDVHCLKMGEGR
jgi:hypothetical protein